MPRGRDQSWFGDRPFSNREELSAHTTGGGRPWVQSGQEHTDDPRGPPRLRFQPRGCLAIYPGYLDPFVRAYPRPPGRVGGDCSARKTFTRRGGAGFRPPSCGDDRRVLGIGTAPRATNSWAPHCARLLAGPSWVCPGGVFNPLPAFPLPVHAQPD